MSTKGPAEVMGNPTPIGLMGLAFGCAALAPIELGIAVPSSQIWIWVMVSGGIMQIWAGIVDLINKNEMGATAFTLYGMLWFIIGWQLSAGIALGSEIRASINFAYLLFTCFMFVGFLTVSLNLSLVFMQFIIIFVLEVLSAFFPSMHKWVPFVAGIAHTLALFQLSWAAAGAILNKLLGRNFFVQGRPPIRHVEKQPEDDFASIKKHIQLRRLIVEVLYSHWEKKGWDWLSTTDICNELNMQPSELVPDSWYLYQKGYIAMDEEKYKQEPNAPKLVRLTASGIDYYGELQEKKFKF